MRLRALLSVAAVIAVAACGPSPPPPAPAAPPVPAPAPAFVVGPGAPGRPGVVDTEMEVRIVNPHPVAVGPPEAPVEKGDCEVVARLFDGDSDRPVNARISLWRVDVPEDASWTGGDQCYGGPVTTLEASVRFEQIPPGRYRIACMEQRSGAEDGPEFAVTRGEQRVDVALLPARTFRARMRIVDLAGKPVASVARATLSSHGGTERDKAPEWVRPRTPKFSTDPKFPAGKPSSEQWGGPDSETVATDAGWLGLRSYTETARNGQASWREEITPPGCATIRVVVLSDDAADETFAALAVKFDELTARVTRPDGSRVTYDDAVIRASGDAIKCPWDAPQGAERASVFRVHVEARGFEPLEFDWSYATRETPRVLVPAQQK